MYTRDFEVFLRCCYIISTSSKRTPVFIHHLHTHTHTHTHTFFTYTHIIIITIITPIIIVINTHTRTHTKAFFSPSFFPLRGGGEEEEDLFVFNDTIEGPRAPAVKPGPFSPSFPPSFSPFFSHHKLMCR